MSKWLKIALMAIVFTLMIRSPIMANEIYVGLGLGMARVMSHDPVADQKSQVSNVAYNASVGYRWFLGEEGEPFYIGPHLNIAGLGEYKDDNKDAPSSEDAGSKKKLVTAMFGLELGKYLAEDFDIAVRTGFVKSLSGTSSNSKSKSSSSSNNISSKIGIGVGGKMGTFVGVGIGYKVAEEWVLTADYYNTLKAPSFTKFELFIAGLRVLF